MEGTNNTEIKENTGAIKDIRSLRYEEICELMENMGHKRFRAEQLFDWLHRRHVRDIGDMNNIPKDLREKLADKYTIKSVDVEEKLVSKIDGTCKYLMRLHDDNIVECVLMKYEYGNSVCISSQVGCRMGCKFCASTIDGLVRSLDAGEMLGQIYAVAEDTGQKIGHVVIMGSGEPLDNFDNLLRFTDIAVCEKGMNMGGRNITVSTCGIVPKITELADKRYQLTLAISLHATTDEKRRKIMPIANKYSIDEILEACGYYFRTTGRRITFEYSLIAGVNDTDEDAEELANIAKRVLGHVNLIPVNPIKERDYKQSPKGRVLAFKNKLEKNGINVTIRREMGRDIEGACGQLRRRFLTQV